MAYRTGKPEPQVVFTGGSAEHWQASFRCGRDSHRLRIIKGFNAEDKMKAQFSSTNEKYARYSGGLQGRLIWHLL
jgi:hypothetical protein